MATYDAALEAIACNQHDVYLVDYRLGEQDGLALLCKAIANGCKAPIIMLTGQGDHEVDIAAMKAGAADYLVKGQIDPPLLDRSIRYAIERKRVEERLQESNCRLAEALSELKAMQQQMIQQERLRVIGQMASGIGHNFNNALTPILSFTELLLTHTKNLDDKQKVTHYLRMMNTSARDAAAAVRRLGEFYRKRDEDETFQSVNLNALVVQAIELTSPKWKDEAQGNNISIDIETDLPEVPSILGNEAELRETLINLIFNAVDAMPEGGTITVRTCTDEAYICIEVSDTGIGMTEEVRRSCLDPFFSTKAECGVGMGLAMVYGTVERHEGEIDIESELGVGTTFRIRLPVQMSRQAESRGQAVKVSSHPLHVLVVDDDSLVREVVTKYLTGDGHTVETAADGHEGLEKFQAGEFDLAVMDRAMPEMNGDELAAAIKQIAPNTPVIMLTGFGDLMKARAERPANVDGLVSKPPTLAAFREVLAKARTV